MGAGTILLPGQGMDAGVEPEAHQSVVGWVILDLVDPHSTGVEGAKRGWMAIGSSAEGQGGGFPHTSTEIEGLRRERASPLQGFAQRRIGGKEVNVRERGTWLVTSCVASVAMA